MRTKSLIQMIAFLLAAPGFAQQSNEYYRLDFIVKELESGKVMNSRTYSMVTQRSSAGTIKVGDKVPLPTEKGQWTFVDVGVNIETRNVAIAGNELSMLVSADISSVAQVGANNAPPLIRQSKWSSSVVIPMKKATTIFSSDGVSDKRQTQVDVTATPVQ